MIFSRLFHRRNRYVQEEYDQSEYADLQTENIVEELNLSDEAQAKRYVVDLCEQMINTAKDLEDAKAEYDLVTSYLTDVQTIEDLKDEEKAPIVACATHVAKLDKERSEFLKTERKLSDTQFAQMQEEEDQLPGIIKRLKSNESYLDAIKKDLAYLEGKKLEWGMLRTESIRTQKIMRKSACYLFASFATLMALLGILSWYLKTDLMLVMTIAAIVAVLAGGYILIRYQDAIRDIKKADVNRNHAISLENHVKIKYVNIKNAVDFTCEKYHVRNGYELQFIYEQYQEEAREKAKFRKTSDDLDYFSKSLIQKLSRLDMYDARAWLNHANAIVDSRELVELKHDLITRRQKLRARIEYSTASISNMRQEALRNVHRINHCGPQIMQIIRQIEAISL